MDAFSDLAFFSVVAKATTFTDAAQQLGITPPVVSKRLAVVERRLGVRLLQRTTRRVGLTPEGETYLVEGAHVLGELEALERTVSGSQAVPKGQMRVAATLGFGRKHLAPALSAFVRRFPGVEVQLQLTDRPVDLVGQGLDLQIRLGELPDSTLTARLLARNRRVLCASAVYLEKAGTLGHPRELAQHACLFIRDNDETFGTWHLTAGSRSEKVKGARAVGGERWRVRGRLGAGWARHPDALAVGSGAAAALRPAPAGAAAMGAAASRRLRSVPDAQPSGGEDAALVDDLLDAFAAHRGAEDGAW